MLIRNEQVSRFRGKIIDECYQKAVYDLYGDDPFDYFYDAGPSYIDMMYSIKALTIENWYPPELIKKLRSKGKTKPSI
jgi:hypothetical protein